MTRIRATCPMCGEVDLRPTDVALEIIRAPFDDASEVRDGSSYRFECPTCDVLVTKPADARIARLLTTGGVEVTVVEGDGERDVIVRQRTPHPEHWTGGPALTFDDLIDFHFLLGDDDLVAEALTPIRDHARR